LCYFYATNLKTADIMDLDQWKFWVFKKEELIVLMKGRKSIAVSAIEAVGREPLTVFELRGAFAK
ncbi:MAG: hypothetical protein ACREBU_20485, partial [Nitrososphaera sp.]